jgi:hypothetical protein
MVHEGMLFNLVQNITNSFLVPAFKTYRIAFNESKSVIQVIKVKLSLLNFKVAVRCETMLAELLFT